MRLAIAFLAVLTLSAAAQDAVPLLPDLEKTPGSANPALSQADICQSAFSTKKYRKGSKADRRCVIERYGKPAYAFTYDHIVPLELGGDDNCDNLWPQARAEAKRKDRLENALHQHVCYCSDITLSDAQALIRNNWLSAYARYVTPKHSPVCAVNAFGPPNS